MTKYCPDLFQNLYIQKLNENESTLGYCCVSQTSDPVTKITIDDSFLVDGRQHFIDTGQLPPACQRCTDLENVGVDSRRIQLRATNHDSSNKAAALKSIHYNCDPICNLKCIVCSSQWSSSWIDDDLKLGRTVQTKIRHTKHNTLAWDLDFKEVEMIYFNGGEPLASRDHINLLNKVIESGTAHDISVIYNTNATIPVTAEALMLWSKFRSVTLMCSIDATHAAFEYIRFPAKWQQVTDNIRSYLDTKLENVFVTITPNLGVHNILYLGDLLEWANDNSLPVRVQDTSGNLSLSNFPVHLKLALVDYMNSLTQHYDNANLLTELVKSIDNPDLAWLHWLNSLDQLRNNNWRESLSKLYQLDSKFFDTWYQDH